MCLGVPGQIVEVTNAKEATADFWGVQRPIRIDQLEVPVAAGDYVIEHAGFAVRVIPLGEVSETLSLYEMVMGEA